MHPITRLIQMLPFKTRRRVLESWLRHLGFSRNDQRWITGRMVQTEYGSKTP